MINHRNQIQFEDKLKLLKIYDSKLAKELEDRAMQERYEDMDQRDDKEQKTFY
jgi:hypothetical protein